MCEPRMLTNRLRPHAYEHQIAARKTDRDGRHSKCLFLSQSRFGRTSILARFGRFATCTDRDLTEMMLRSEICNGARSSRISISVSDLDQSPDSSSCDIWNVYER